MTEAPRSGGTPAAAPAQYDVWGNMDSQAATQVYARATELLGVLAPASREPTP